MVSFSESVKICLRHKFFVCKGRATLAEYWWFQLFFFLTIISFNLFIYLVGLVVEIPIFFVYLYCIAIWTLFIPLFCVSVRRLHDVGHTGFFLLVGLIPIIGGVILFFEFISKSDSNNQYGPKTE